MGRTLYNRERSKAEITITMDDLICKIDPVLGSWRYA